MGQLIVVYRASGEYMAIAMRAELASHGITSVQLLNEIPMKPGFTFGALPWAEILISEADLPEALAVVAECELALNGDATSQPYPPAMKFNTAVCLTVFVISLVLFPPIANFSLFDFVFYYTSLPAPVFLLIALNAAFAIAFTVLNRRMLSKESLAAMAGLLALPVILGWLVIMAIPWLIRQGISHAISLGRSNR